MEKNIAVELRFLMDLQNAVNASFLLLLSDYILLGLRYLASSCLYLSILLGALNWSSGMIVESRAIVAHF